MRKLLKTRIVLIILIVYSRQTYAQSGKETVDSLMNRLTDVVETLPLTITSGHGDFATQSRYTIRWDKKKRTIVVVDERYKPNSNDRSADTYRTMVRIKDLHTKGILIKQLQPSDDSGLQLFTARNKRKIQTVIDLT